MSNVSLSNNLITRLDKLMFLRLLSGCKSSLMFTYENYEFHFNHKFRLKYLNKVGSIYSYGWCVLTVLFWKVLDDCLKPICFYAKVVLKIQEFINDCINFEVTQVYEIFSECLNEYLKYFNKQLSIIADVLLKKGKSFWFKLKYL